MDGVRDEGLDGALRHYDFGFRRKIGRVYRGHVVPVDKRDGRSVITRKNRVWDVGGSQMKAIENENERGASGELVRAKVETGGA